MLSKPRVSVCLLSYNHSAVLRETIDSILRQTVSDFELIISDDRSRDDSWSIIVEYATRDPRVRAVRPQRNLGMAENANFAVAQARADYIALLHHDDVCRSDLLQKWLEVADENPSVAFVSNAFAIEGRAAVDYHPFQRVTPGAWALERQLLGRFDCPVRGTALIRRACWERIGGMRSRFGLIADVDLWMRLAARWDVGYVCEPLLMVRAVRPEDYPADYVAFSWNRMRILFELHGDNRRTYYANRRLRSAFERARFRARVSAHELRWLAYGVLKRRNEILATSHQVENPYELAPVRYLRRKLQIAATGIHDARP